MALLCFKCFTGAERGTATASVHKTNHVKTHKIGSATSFWGPESKPYTAKIPEARLTQSTPPMTLWGTR